MSIQLVSAWLNMFPFRDKYCWSMPPVLNGIRGQQNSPLPCGCHGNVCPFTRVTCWYWTLGLWYYQITPWNPEFYPLERSSFVSDQNELKPAVTRLSRPDPPLSASQCQWSPTRMNHSKHQAWLHIELRSNWWAPLERLNVSLQHSLVFVVFMDVRVLNHSSMIQPHRFPLDCKINIQVGFFLWKIWWKLTNLLSPLPLPLEESPKSVTLYSLHS